jgi:hypothetical protein
MGKNSKLVPEGDVVGGKKNPQTQKVMKVGKHQFDQMSRRGGLSSPKKQTGG